MSDEYDIYEFDVSVQPIVTWFTSRLKQGKRDAIDNLGKRIIADTRIPRKGSLGTYRSYLSLRKYSQDDLAVFESAWQEFRNEELS